MRISTPFITIKFSREKTDAQITLLHIDLWLKNPNLFELKTDWGLEVKK